MFDIFAMKQYMPTTETFDIFDMVQYVEQLESFDIFEMKQIVHLCKDDFDDANNIVSTYYLPSNLFDDEASSYYLPSDLFDNE